MELYCLEPQEYARVAKNTYFYNSTVFHEINKGKADAVRYMVFRSSKNKLAIIAGIVGNMMKFPYSAPFSMFDKLSQNIEVEELEAAFECLEEYCLKNGIKEIMFRLPPAFYDEAFLAKIQNVLLRRNYEISFCDLNYHLCITDEQEFWKHLKRNGKKNLNQALQYDYRFVHCDTWEEKKLAYDIIAENRKSRGYPLRMTWDAVSVTCGATESDFFLVGLDGKYVASAVIFAVTADICQVIYWGNLPESAHQRPMNYLAYRLYGYYAEKGIRILDIGPSSEEGIPNYGLCSYKESIGCVTGSKYTYRKKIVKELQKETDNEEY